MDASRGRGGAVHHQPAAGHQGGGFDWTKIDADVRVLASKGIEPLPQLFGAPTL